jgi:hypothetical protein
MSEPAMAGVAAGESVSPSGSASGAHRVPWNIAKRIAFRFFFSYFVLFGFPFPIDRIPFIDEIIDNVYYEPWKRFAAWVGEQFLGHPLLTMENGKSDRSVDFVQAFLIAVAAVLATAIWSLLDRRRMEYARLLEALRIYVRFMLVFPMFLYAAIKIVKIQFPDPEPDILMQMYGDAGPGKLLSAFMGHSSVYSAFVGATELVAGLLLCFRRTAMLGAIVAAATLLNVVLINFCFHFGVKLWSTNLLVMAVFLIGLDVRRLAEVFVVNRPMSSARSAALPSLPLLERWLDRRKRKYAKVALNVLLIGLAAMAATKPILKYRKPQPHAFFGIYEVESFVRNGESQPLVITDAKCWRGAIVNTYGVLTVRFMDETAERYRTKTDVAKKTLALSTWDQDESKRALLSYAQDDPEHLTLAGSFMGDKLEVRLRKIERKFRLLEEKFHVTYDGPQETKR